MRSAWPTAMISSTSAPLISAGELVEARLAGVLQLRLAEVEQHVGRQRQLLDHRARRLGCGQRHGCGRSLRLRGGGRLGLRRGRPPRAPAPGRRAATRSHGSAASAGRPVAGAHALAELADHHVAVRGGGVAGDGRGPVGLSICAGSGAGERRQGAASAMALARRGWSMGLFISCCPFRVSIAKSSAEPLGVAATRTGLNGPATNVPRPDYRRTRTDCCSAGVACVHEPRLYRHRHRLRRPPPRARHHAAARKARPKKPAATSTAPSKRPATRCATRPRSSRNRTD